MSAICFNLDLCKILSSGSGLTTLSYNLSGNTGIGGNAGEQYFLFSLYFPPFPKQISVFEYHLFCGLSHIKICPARVAQW